MTREEAVGSLAEDAAAWVPPWARPSDGNAVEVDAVEAVEPAEPAEPTEPTEPEDLPADLPVDPEVLSSEPAPPSFEPAPADDVPMVEPAAALAMVSDEELRGAIEAILLVVDEPVGDVMLAQVLEQPTDRVNALLGNLANEYMATERGFELRRAAGGWRLYTRPCFAGYVEKFVLDGQQIRLTQAALETLAVVAYKQPVARSRISAIRGVNCDGVMRTLVSRGLIEECGSDPDSGALLYRTTSLFLEKLGLDELEQLPPLAPFLPDDVDAVADGTG
jgi:segregation and condensation protein B